MASRISDARSRPKVIKRIESEGTPSLMRESAASISTVVLPVPAAPLSKRGDPRCAMAAFC